MFVDTNILLDFYRLPGPSAARQLKALERHQGILITSDQMRMEFLKNRQKVVAESIKGIAKPNKTSVPALVGVFSKRRCSPSTSTARWPAMRVYARKLSPS